jgi:hypothetical protein
LSVIFGGKAFEVEMNELVKESHGRERGLASAASLEVQ